MRSATVDTRSDTAVSWLVTAAEEILTRRDLFQLIQRPVRGLEKCPVVLIQTEYNALLFAFVLPLCILWESVME